MLSSGLKALRNEVEWSSSENWYFYNLFYCSRNDSRPFVDVHWRHASKWYSTKNTTVNFGNAEGVAWFGGILAVAFYPTIRKYFKTTEEAVDSLVKEAWLNKENWFGPWKMFYSCAKDPRWYVPVHPDQQRLSLRPRLSSGYRSTLNLSHNMARLWLLALAGLSMYPFFRKK